MSVRKTRVDTSELQATISQVEARVDHLEVSLKRLCVVMTADERRGLARPRRGFTEAALTMNALMDKWPHIATAADYDVEAVREDLENAMILNALLQKLKSLQRVVSDSRLLWLAEAQDQTFAAYNIAKLVARRDGSLAECIEPIQEILARGPRKEDDDDEESEEGEEGPAKAELKAKSAK